MEKRLRELQLQVYHAGKEWEPDYHADYSPKLMYSYAVDEELYELTYYGHEEEAFAHMLQFLTVQENANYILSLTFDGPDEGENGTSCWDFRQLANSPVIFPNLKSFRVKLTDPGDHNQQIIGENYGLEENGMIGGLLQKMPALEQLTIPSAPDKTFFQTGPSPLFKLVMQTGYDHQHFIDNLAASDNFPKLMWLDFTDHQHCYPGPADLSAYTPFESYKKLFASKATIPLAIFKLRSSILTKEQLFELQDMRPDIQVLWIEGGRSSYIRHLQQAEKNRNEEME